MFVQSEKFAQAHGGNKTDVSIFGQESNPTTWRLAHMNLAIHGIEANLGPTPGARSLKPTSSTASLHSPCSDLVDRAMQAMGIRW